MFLCRKCAAGKFGMGSRSYFHYTDLLSVVSGSKYVCLDPLNLIYEDGGSMDDLDGGSFCYGVYSRYLWASTLTWRLAKT